MKASSHPHLKIKAKLAALISPRLLNTLAKTTGFCARAARKIDAASLVMGFFLCCAMRNASLPNWAAQIALLSDCANAGCTASKQALCKRLGAACSRFAQALLKCLLAKRITAELQQRARPLPAAARARARKPASRSPLHSFSAVLVQDSTTIHLPQALSSAFKGNTSRGITKAVARIQCILDIRTMQFRDFLLGAFCENDQRAASMVYGLLDKGSLLLRDLGYFVLSGLRCVAERGAFYLTRLRYGVALFDASGKPIRLNSLLRAAARTGLPLDLKVLVGEKERLEARLIAVPLDARTAAARKRRASRDRDRRLNHSRDYMLRLGFRMMLTNVDGKVWSAADAVEVYGLRWRIELLFKGLKSAGLHIEQLCIRIRSNAERARSMLLLSLCFVVLQMRLMSQLCSGSGGPGRGESQGGTENKKGAGAKGQPVGAGSKPSSAAKQAAAKAYVSVNKMLAWICDNFVIWLIAPPWQQRQYMRLFGCYEQRPDRINSAQRVQSTLVLS